MDFLQKYLVVRNSHRIFVNRIENSSLKFTLLEYILTVENIIIVDLDLKIREDVLHIEICF